MRMLEQSIALVRARAIMSFILNLDSDHYIIYNSMALREGGSDGILMGYF
ncbi:putative 1,4-beta-D-xylan synthase [Arabidopsis thaliana]